MTDEHSPEPIAPPVTGPRRYFAGSVIGCVVGGFVAVMLLSVQYGMAGAMGHGGTATDWNQEFNAAAGMGAFIGALFGAVIAHATRPSDAIKDAGASNTDGGTDN